MKVEEQQIFSECYGQGTARKRPETNDGATRTRQKFFSTKAMEQQLPMKARKEAMAKRHQDSVFSNESGNSKGSMTRITSQVGQPAKADEASRFGSHAREINGNRILSHDRLYN